MSDLKSLSEFYQNLCQRLNVTPNEKLLTQITELIASGDRWTVLDLKDEKLDYKHCQIIAQLIPRSDDLVHLNLEKCEMGDDAFIEIADSIAAQGRIARLDLALNKLTTKSALSLCSLVSREGAQLVFLDLRGNSLFGKGGVLLGKSVASPNCRLQVLRIEDVELDEKGLSALSESLGSNKELLNLHVGANMIDGRGARILSDGLRLNERLTNLDIRFNKLRDEGAKWIANLLKHTNSLQGLVLWKNGIGREGLSFISESLASNKSLKVLDIGQNPVGPDGIIALKDALLVNKTLTSVGLASTKMASEGCIALAEGLETNRSLMRIDLRRNAIGVAGLMALTLSLKMNSKINYIALDAPTQDADDVELHLRTEIESRCERNGLSERESEVTKTEESTPTQDAKQSSTTQQLSSNQPQNTDPSEGGATETQSQQSYKSVDLHSGLELRETVSSSIIEGSPTQVLVESPISPADSDQATNVASLQEQTTVDEKETIVDIAPEPKQDQQEAEGVLVNKLTSAIASKEENEDPFAEFDSSYKPVQKTQVEAKVDAIKHVISSEASNIEPTSSHTSIVDPFDDIFSSPQIQTKDISGSVPTTPAKTVADATAKQELKSTPAKSIADEFDELWGM
eukprot:TRINITY_DN7218_c0_g1_i1.p1 TRINITY_DN7218_c0_g1~~TRINITY_DN7218_c0_g1_i1.p1  ORF type:complete len:629 (-),score=141.18 TRINITY_DN7218_c0_g1_i1:258-2144(-)